MTDPFAAPLSKATTNPEPAALFDDKGEPDFSGWLNAQSGAKPKKPLPKGLAKTSAAGSMARPTMGAKTNSTGGVKKVLPAPMKPKVVKKEEKKEDEDDDAWGDAW